MTPAKSPNRGGPVNMYLREEDIKDMRDLGAWLMKDTGKRVSDSQVLRACLRMAKTGDALRKAFLAVYSTDGRRK
jgi:hypothetical protein